MIIRFSGWFIAAVPGDLAICGFHDAPDPAPWTGPTYLTLDTETHAHIYHLSGVEKSAVRAVRIYSVPSEGVIQYVLFLSYHLYTGSRSKSNHQVFVQGLFAENVSSYSTWHVSLHLLRSSLPKSNQGASCSPVHPQKQRSVSAGAFSLLGHVDLSL